jgi:hypothetical protein
MSSAVSDSLLLWMNSSNTKLHNNGISRAGAHLSPHLSLYIVVTFAEVMSCAVILSKAEWLWMINLGLSISKHLCPLRHCLELFMRTKKNWEKASIQQALIHLIKKYCDITKPEFKSQMFRSFNCTVYWTKQLTSQFLKALSVLKMLVSRLT